MGQALDRSGARGRMIHQGDVRGPEQDRQGVVKLRLSERLGKASVKPAGVVRLHPGVFPVGTHQQEGEVGEPGFGPELRGPVPVRPSPASSCRGPPRRRACPGLAALRSSTRASRRRRRRTAGAPVGKDFLEDSAIRGVVVHHEHARRPSKDTLTRGSPRDRASSRRSRVVKWKMLPDARPDSRPRSGRP